MANAQVSAVNVFYGAYGAAGLVAGPDGAMWFASTTGYIGRITIVGDVSTYSIPYSGSYPVSITAGSDGALWFTERIGQVGSITTKLAITEYPFNFVYPDDVPSITTGPDGTLWFIDIYDTYSPGFGDIAPGVVPTYFNWGYCCAWPQQIASGPDGSIWISDGGGYFSQVIPTARRNAVDFSAAAGVPSPSILTQFTQAGVQYAVAEAPQTPDGGLASQQLNAFYNAGIQTGAYCFLYFYQGADSGTQQAENCLSNISAPLSDGIVSFVALDVEQYLPPH